MLSWFKKKKVLPRWKLLAMLMIGIWSGLMLSQGLSISNIWIIIFVAYYGLREFIFTSDWNMLFELNFETLKQTISWLNLDIEIIKESELNVKGNSTERLVNICKSLDADNYISGIGGKNYLNEELFIKNNIILNYHDYSSIIYPQHNSESFLPNMSILDLLANMGPESQKLLKDYS